MPVRKRFEKRRQMLGDDAADWLRGGDGGAWIYFQTADELAALWHDHGELLVAEHVDQYPGTRPERWWHFDAPREPLVASGSRWHGKLFACRRRIQGVGVPKYEALVSYYNGRSVDVHGKPIGTEYAEGHFPYLAIDPKDPPMYESEAAFLDRRGLFLPGERRRLKRADFALESILDIFDLELDG
jgi:hypothetical protein